MTVTHINQFRTKYEGSIVAERIASRVADALMADLAVYDEKLRNGPYRRSKSPLASTVEIIEEGNKRIAEDE